MSLLTFLNSSYGIDEGLIFSFPIRTSDDGLRTEIVQGLSIESIQLELDKTKEELKLELSTVKEILRGSKL